MSWSADPQSLIPEVVTATLNVLSAAARVRSIQRVVLTSSVVTARSRCPGTGEITDYIVNESQSLPLYLKHPWRILTCL